MGSCYSSVSNRANQQSVQYRGPVARQPGQVRDVQSLVDSQQPSVTISWQPPTNYTSVNIIWYTVRYKPDDSDEYKYVSLPPSHGRLRATLTIENGLEPLKTFTFQVRAETANTYGGWSAGIQEYIAAIRPGLVRDVESLVDPHQPSVTISWMPPDNHRTLVDVTSYTVRFFSKADNSDEYKFLYLSYPPSDGRVCATLTTENGLEPCTTYTFEVQAKATSVSGGWSAGVDEYIDWYCRYPPCYSSRLKLDASSLLRQSSPWDFNSATSGRNMMVHKSARPPIIYDFCCKDHKTRFDAKYCLFPECTKLMTSSSGSIDALVSTRNHFCGQEHWNGAVQKGHSFFVSMDPASQQYTFARKKFEQSWAKEKGACPEVQGVLAVINPSNEEQLRIYRETLPRRHNNTEMYFHGTCMDCSLKELHVMCGKEKCGVCGISKNGFQQKCISGRWQRFGRAFYLAPNSSKSHDYCVIRSLSSYSSYRGMFLCEVAAGKKHSLRHNSVFLKGPPDGCHSVYGKSKFMFLKGDLNYDEIVIFNEKAICPRFVILYK